MLLGRPRECAGAAGPGPPVGLVLAFSFAPATSPAAVPPDRTLMSEANKQERACLFPEA